jgi:hypothetical protein
MNLLKLESEFFLNSLSSSLSSFVCSRTHRGAGSLSWFSDWTQSVQGPDLLDRFGEGKVVEGGPIHDLDQLDINFLSRSLKHWKERSLEHWKVAFLMLSELSCSGCFELTWLNADVGSLAVCTRLVLT